MGDRYIHSAVEADCTTHERNIQPAFQHDQATAERYTSPSPTAKISKVKFYNTIVETGWTFAVNDAAGPRSAVFLKARPIIANR